MVQKTQNMMDKTDMRPLGDHLDMFQHIHRDWNQEAEGLTQVAREKEATWNSHVMEEGTRVEAVRSIFDGGVNIQCYDKIKHKVGSAFVMQIDERIEESTQKMKWKTIVEVAKVLPDDATITQAECTAVVEAEEPFAVWLELERKKTMKVDGREKQKTKQRMLLDPHLYYRHLFMQAFRIRALFKR